MSNLLICFLAVVWLSCVAAQGTYTITAANTIRPNSAFSVAINYNAQSGSNAQLRIVARVTGQESDSNKTNTVSGQIVLQPRTTEILHLQIRNWQNGNYKLEITGSGAINFQRSTSLNFNGKEFSLLIETDKGIYQLEQSVMFRVVAVNSNLLPYRNQPLTVYINDAENNRIKQWNVRLPENGIFENTLQLSSRPVLGQWQIFATVRDVTATKQFTAAEYVLPRFEVVVEPPPFITTDDKQFSITLKATYTFGGGVPGNYLINITQSYCSFDRFSSCNNAAVSLTGQFTGTVNVPVQVSDFNLSPTSSATFYMIAVVTERFTGITRNDTATFQRLQNRQQLAIDQGSTFKPKSPYVITVKLQTPDGRPVTNAVGVVNLTYTFTVDNADQNPKTTSLRFGQDGSASITVSPPMYSNSLTTTATYNDLTAYGYAQAVQSLSDKFISISINTKEPKVGDTIPVKVDSTFPMESSIIVQVIGRGTILQVASIPINSPVSTGTLNLRLTREMAPHVRILVLYVSGCGEIVGDSLDIAVGGAIQTPLTLQLSNTTVEPGDNITIRIKSRPSTFVGIKSVDESVLLLQNGNDITNEQILNELQAYDIGVPTFYSINAPYRVGLIRRPTGALTLSEIIEYAGLVLLTNGLYARTTTCGRFIGGPIMFNRLELMDGARPMAGDAAVGGMASNSGSFVQPTRTRKTFPETWLWNNFLTSLTGEADATFTVPDTITKWIISGIAINNQTGLGVTDAPTNLTVFRPFFMVVNLPFSVIHAEIVTLQVLVFNYLPQNLNPVIVSLTKLGNVSQYDIVEQTASSGVPLQKNLSVRSNGIEQVTFRIRPTVVDTIQLNIKAISPYAGDAVISNLLVKAEGSPQYFAKSVFIDLRNISTFTIPLNALIPANAVPGSEYVEFSCTGDMMGPVIANVRNLIRMPTGCGEQNMINFVPNAMIIKYLENSNSLTPEIRARSISYLESGYQNQLRYKRPDGSFSAFGRTDPSGSTWLTAYVVKCFVFARFYITIDNDVILAAKRYLVSKQLPSGEFKEDGRIIHTAMQGGSGRGVAMAAFVLISFLENADKNNTEFDPAIAKGRAYLESNLNSALNVYELCITTYALQLANSNSKDAAFALLTARKTPDGDMTYWHYAVPRPSGSDWYYSTASSYDVEATGYALLTYVLRIYTSIEDSLSITRWMVANRNALGSYSSSQDTVIGIQSLAAVAPKFSAPKGSSTTLTITYLTSTASFTLNNANALVIQKQQLPKLVRSVIVSARGNGVAIAQLAVNYNIIKIGSPDPSFRITQLVTPKDRGYSLTTCVRYLLNGTTNMVLVEIATLSGHVWDGDSNPQVGSLPELTRVETSQANTLVALYFNSIPSAPSQICISVNAIQTTTVDNLRGAMIAAYDYYETSKRAELFYNLPAIKLPVDV